MVTDIEQNLSGRISVLFLALAAAFLTGCKPDVHHATIVGGSMAPNLLGEHYRLVCDDCGYAFKVDLAIPKQKTFACPNCGFAKIPKSDSTSAPMRVKILPEAKFERWDLVAVKVEGNDFHVVKRLIGLPNEELTIASGDLWSAKSDRRERICKPLTVQREIRIPVHDTNFRPASTAERRWTSESGKWKADRHFEFEGDGGELHWLSYRHWRGYHHIKDRFDETAVEDSYAFNQAINRTLVPCPDLFLEVEFAQALKSELAVRVWHGADEYVFSVSPDQQDERSFQINFSAYGEAVGQGKMVQLESALRKLECSTFDGLITLALNGQSIDTFPVPGKPATGTGCRFDLGASSGRVEISRIRLYRDIYYRDLINRANKPYFTAKGFFFLGDNVPNSIDSRHWPPENEVTIIGLVEPD